MFKKIEEVPAVVLAAGAGEVLVLDHPELLAVVKAQLLVGLDGAVGEEGNAGEGEVLVVQEHLGGGIK